jgi:hypothetical protein
VDAETLAAHGLGLDVRRALERRKEILHERSRGTDAPSAAAQTELERRAVGEGMGARTGQIFLASVPDGFRGRLEIGPEGSPFAVVSDGQRFVLVPATPELRKLAGTAVEVTRDADGIVRVRDRGRGPER